MLAGHAHFSEYTSKDAKSNFQNYGLKTSSTFKLYFENLPNLQLEALKSLEIRPETLQIYLKMIVASGKTFLVTSGN